MRSRSECGVVRTDLRACAEIFSAASEAKDNSTCVFLQPYISEQVQSEDMLHGMLKKAESMSVTPGLIFLLDAEMGGNPQGTA